MRAVSNNQPRASLRSQGLRVYLNEFGLIRLETKHYRCELRREEFLALLRKAAPQ